MLEYTQCTPMATDTGKFKPRKHTGQKPQCVCEKVKKELKNTFLKIYAFISYQYNILLKLKKIEFHGYFTHGLVLQRKIKAWCRNNHSCHK